MAGTLRPCAYLRHTTTDPGRDRLSVIRRRWLMPPPGGLPPAFPRRLRLLRAKASRQVGTIPFPRTLRSPVSESAGLIRRPARLLADKDNKRSVAVRQPSDKYCHACLGLCRHDRRQHLRSQRGHWVGSESGEVTATAHQGVDHQTNRSRPRFRPAARRWPNARRSTPTPASKKKKRGCHHGHIPMTSPTFLNLISTEPRPQDHGEEFRFRNPPRTGALGLPRADGTFSRHTQLLRAYQTKAFWLQT